MCLMVLCLLVLLDKMCCYLVCYIIVLMFSIVIFSNVRISNSGVIYFRQWIQGICVIVRLFMIMVEVGVIRFIILEVDWQVVMIKFCCMWVKFVNGVIMGIVNMVRLEEEGIRKESNIFSQQVMFMKMVVERLEIRFFVLCKMVWVIILLFMIIIMLCVILIISVMLSKFCVLLIKVLVNVFLFICVIMLMIIVVVRKMLEIFVIYQLRIVML